ncbi:unnamed protein product [Paramecium pentaurelia]|uniref:Uncharacterized protein n=1 Tax=Paramecium pentaurelia TaxID=43138 RepID=A0A8S1RXF9_9CILI|nr:unnamed protein product [Paramecium pentaurelia]
MVLIDFNYFQAITFKKQISQQEEFNLCMQHWSQRITICPIWHHKLQHVIYLLSFALGRCFRIEKDQVKIGQLFKKVSKIKLFYELEAICLKKNINFGFTILKLPDKKWLTNVLFTLNEQSPIFDHYQDADKVVGLTKDDVVLLKSLDNTLGRKKSMKFFKRTHKQVEEKKVKIAKQKLNNVKTRLIRKKEESERIEQGIRALPYKIQEIIQPQQSIQDAPILKKQQKQ